MRRVTPLHLIATAAVVVALSPLLYLAVRAASAGMAQVWDILARTRTLELSLASLGLAIAVAGTCILVGVPLAWLATRAAIPGGRWWLVALSLPLAIPSYVTAYTWLAAFPGAAGFWPTWGVLVLSCLPYVILPVAAVLTQLDPAYDDVARTLGDCGIRRFRRTTAPLLFPAAGAGGLLVALYTLSDFGAVSMLRFDTFTRVIYTSYRAAFDRTSAAVLSLVLVVLALLCIAAERKIRTRHQQWRVGGGSARTADRVHLGRWRWPTVGLLTAVVGLGVGFPAVMLTRLLLTSAGDGFTPASWISAGVNTTIAASVGALIALLLAVPVAVLAARYRDRWSRTTETGAFVSHALPGVVVGLALVFMGLTLFPQLYQTLVMLGFAYAVLFLSNAIGSVRAATEQVPPQLEDVARTLGDRPIMAWWKVTARISAPGILAGTLLVLLTAMKELPATLMLRPTGFDTLATEMWQQTSVAAFGQAAPYALGLILLASVPAFILARLTARKEQTA